MRVGRFHIIYQTFARDFYYFPRFICNCSPNPPMTITDEDIVVQPSPPGDSIVSSIYRWGFWNFWYEGFVGKDA